MHPNTLSENVRTQTAEILDRRVAVAIDLRRLRNGSAGEGYRFQENCHGADDDQ